MSDQAYAMLIAAVNLAKSEQICSLKALKARMLREHPESEADIDSALRFWAQYEQGK